VVSFFLPNFTVTKFDRAVFPVIENASFKIKHNFGGILIMMKINSGNAFFALAAAIVFLSGATVFAQDKSENQRRTEDFVKTTIIRAATKFHTKKFVKQRSRRKSFNG
jgi:hypothetical protein